MSEDVVDVPLSKAQLDYLCEFIDSEILEICEGGGANDPKIPFLEDLHYLLEIYRQYF